MASYRDRIGSEGGYFDIQERADLMIEAPIEQVTPAVEAQLPDMFGKNWRLESDMYGKPSPDEHPLMWIFQLRGQSWTQICTWSPGRRNLELAKRLSESLATRSFCVELTDREYNAHALFNNGDVEELSVVGATLAKLLQTLGVPYTSTAGEPKPFTNPFTDPSFADEPDFHFQSKLRPELEVKHKAAEESDEEEFDEEEFDEEEFDEEEFEDDEDVFAEIQSLVKQIGFYLHGGYPSYSGTYGFVINNEPEDETEVNRLDLILRER